MDMQARPKTLVAKLIFSLLVFLAFYIVTKSFLPVFLAIAMSFLLYPVVNFLENRKVFGHAVPNTLAVLASFLVFGLFLFVAANILIVPLATQVSNLLRAMPGLAARANESFNLFLGTEAQKLPPSFRAMLQQGASSISNTLLGFLKDMLTGTVQVARSLAGLVLVPFLSFYFLKDWRTLKDMVVDLFSYEKQPLANQVLGDIGRMLCTYMDNMFKLCFIAAFCLTLGNWILGVQYTLVLGFLALITEIIPLVGSVVGTFAAVFIALLQNPSLALKVLLLYLVYYQLDSQFIMPNLMGHSITLHPVLIILAVLIGGQIGGVPGLVFAVPVLIIVKVLYGYFWHVGEKPIH